MNSISPLLYSHIFSFNMTNLFTFLKCILGYTPPFRRVNTFYSHSILKNCKCLEPSILWIWVLEYCSLFNISPGSSTILGWKWIMLNWIICSWFNTSCDTELMFVFLLCCAFLRLWFPYFSYRHLQAWDFLECKKYKRNSTAQRDRWGLSHQVKALISCEA